MLLEFLSLYSCPIYNILYEILTSKVCINCNAMNIKGRGNIPFLPNLKIRKCSCPNTCDFIINSLISIDAFLQFLSKPIHAQTPAKLQPFSKLFDNQKLFGKAWIFLPSLPFGCLGFGIILKSYLKIEMLFLIQISIN